MTDNACQAQAFGWPGGGLGPRVLPWRPALCGAEARDDPGRLRRTKQQARVSAGLQVFAVVPPSQSGDRSGSVLLVLFLFRDACSRDDLLLDLLGHLVVMGELHVEVAPATGDRA